MSNATIATTGPSAGKTGAQAGTRRASSGIQPAGHGATAALLIGLVALAYGTASLASPAHAFAEACANEQFRTGPSAALDQCRAYEMVTPLDKNGQEISTIAIDPHATVQVAADGDGFAYPTYVPLPETESGTPVQQNIATRTGGGWQSRSISGPAGTAPLQFLSFNEALSADLDSWVPNSNVALTPDAAALGGRPALYLAERNGDETSYTLVPKRAEELGPPPFYLFGEPFLLEASTPDLDTLVFQSTLKLLPNGANEEQKGLYAWSNGSLEYASILPEGVAAATNAAAGARTVGLLRGEYQGYNRLSSDGRFLYFTVVSPAASRGIWMRDLQADQTTPASASERAGGDPAKALAATFELASEDGDLAFFRSPNKLTEDATAAAGKEDLYRWERTAPAGSRLTDLTTADAEGGRVVGTVGASSNGDTVYFVARGVLAAGAVAGEANLYVWQEGEGIDLVAVLAGTDGGVWSTTAFAEPRYRAARTTRDGGELLFASHASLTGYDTDEQEQVYLYKAGDGGEPGALICVSCNPQATQSAADASLFELSNTAGLSTVVPQKLPANLSSNGERAFFQTTEGLVAADTNGRQDIYLWEAGDLQLISDGSAAYGSEFIGASSEGDNAFFVTRAQLVPSDTDKLADIYDARAGGGLASQHPSSATPCLSEASCRSEAQPPVAPQAPGTSSFVGPTNPRARGRACASLAGQTKRISRRARRARSAGHSRQARRLARRAGREARRAKRCRRTTRGGSR